MLRLALSALARVHRKHPNLHETKKVRSQFATSSWGGRRYLPYAFTEHGALMAANILNSPRAVQVSVQVVRAFIRLRELLISNKELARQLAELEKKYDTQFKIVFNAIRELMKSPEPKRRPIGFLVSREK